MDSVENIKYNNKDHLVLEFSIRWWYALQHPWPPVNFDYTDLLREKNLRKVEAARWKSDPELDANQFKKVLEI